MDSNGWGIADAAAFVAAIDRELELATTGSVELVRKGRLTQQESEYVVGLLRDVRSDLAHAFGPFDPDRVQRQDPAVSWRSKIQWIKRELADRRELYPELVRKCRLTEDEARRGIRVIAALHRLYWQQLFMWVPDEQPAIDYLARIREAKNASSAELEALRSSEGAKIYRELVRKHMAAVDNEEHGQRELLVA